MGISSNVRSIRQLTVALRDARVTKRITQAELAERTGLTRPWISQFEQGRINNASISRILLLCRELEVNLTVSYGTPADAPERPDSTRGDDTTASEPSGETYATGSESTGRPIARQSGQPGNPTKHFQHFQAPSPEQMADISAQLQSLANFPTAPYLAALRNLSPEEPTSTVSMTDESATDESAKEPTPDDPSDTSQRTPKERNGEDQES